MKKKVLWKDSLQAITGSLGRFIAIFLLVMLGTFTLIGLKSSGPDMRQTAIEFYKKHSLADITVTSNYGLDNKDIHTIKTQKNIKRVDFGYYQDAKVKKSRTSLRVFSQTKNVSTYELIKGKRPTNKNEIAISYLLKNKYHTGQEITLENGQTLKSREFKVVGFVKSSEYMDKSNIGQTNIGTGQLDGIAITDKSAFKGNYTIARIIYNTTYNLNPYAKRYNELIDKYQDNLNKELNKNRKTKYQKYKANVEQAESQISQAKDQVNKLAQVSPEQAKVLQKEIDQKSKNVDKQKLLLDQTGYPKYTVNTRDSNPGYTIYRSNSERVDILSNVFPTILFVIAALVSLTTMTRFVDEERINIGTLKALGYSDMDVCQKFIMYSLISSGLGVVVGSSLGYLILPKIVFEAYAANSTLTNMTVLFSWKYLAIAVIIAIASTTLAALWVLKNNLKESPAQLLLPKPPKKGSKILLEKISPLWKRMNFTYKVTARNIFRYKSRMLMTIFGVAGCTGLLVMGLGIKDSLSGISQIQYTDIIKYDLVTLQHSNLTSRQKNNLDTELNKNKIKQYLDIHYENLTKKAGTDNAEQDISLIVPSSSKALTKFVRLENRQTGKKYTVTSDSVIISEKLATLLHAKKGSKIKLKDDNGKWHKLKVTGVTEMYIGHYVFMGKNAYKKAFKNNYRTNGQLVTLKENNKRDIQKSSENLMDTGALTTVLQNSNNQKTINNILGGLNKVIVILILIATILAIVVIYNLTNINVLERIRELSTIKVLGFFDKEVTMYIYRETILLSAIGILVGYIIGIWLHEFIITSLPPTNAMFDPSLRIGNFIISTLIPSIITIILAIIMHRKIKSVDMLESLKSVE